MTLQSFVGLSPRQVVIHQTPRQGTYSLVKLISRSSKYWARLARRMAARESEPQKIPRSLSVRLSSSLQKKIYKEMFPIMIRTSGKPVLPSLFC